MDEHGYSCIMHEGSGESAPKADLGSYSIYTIRDPFDNGGGNCIVRILTNTY